jgi:hypothetical protein
MKKALIYLSQNPKQLMMFISYIFLYTILLPFIFIGFILLIIFWVSLVVYYFVFSKNNTEK